MVQKVIDTEKEKKKELQKAIKKCLKEKVFTSVNNATDEDDMEEILDKCSFEELKNIN